MESDQVSQSKQAYWEQSSEPIKAGIWRAIKWATQSKQMESNQASPSKQAYGERSSKPIKANIWSLRDWFETVPSRGTLRSLVDSLVGLFQRRRVAPVARIRHHHHHLWLVGILHLLLLLFLRLHRRLLRGLFRRRLAVAMEMRGKQMDNWTQKKPKRYETKHNMNRRRFSLHSDPSRRISRFDFITNDQHQKFCQNVHKHKFVVWL